MCRVAYDVLIACLSYIMLKKKFAWFMNDFVSWTVRSTYWIETKPMSFFYFIICNHFLYSSIPKLVVMHSLWRHLVGGTTNKLLRSIPSGMSLLTTLCLIFSCDFCNFVARLDLDKLSRCAFQVWQEDFTWLKFISAMKLLKTDTRKPLSKRLIQVSYLWLLKIGT